MKINLAEPTTQAVGTLAEAMESLDGIRADAADYRVPLAAVNFSARDEALAMLVSGAGETVSLTPWRSAYRQASALAGIPWEYAQTMIERGAPELAAHNLNRWLNDSTDAVTVRAVGSMGRAILSERYRSIEPLTVLEAAVEEMRRIAPGTLNFRNGAVDPLRSTFRLESTALRGEVAVGDVISGGVEIAASEIGDGSVRIALWLHRLICRNGAVSKLSERTSIRHLGGGDDRFVFDRVRAGVRAAFSQFNDALSTMQQAREQKIVEPVTAISRLADALEFSEERRNRMLLAFGAESDATGFGLFNAVTRAAQSEPTIGGRIEMERAGGDVLAQLATPAFIARLNAPSNN